MCFYKIYSIPVPIPVPIPLPIPLPIPILQLIIASPSVTPIHACSKCLNTKHLSFLKCCHIICRECSMKMLFENDIVCNECIRIKTVLYLKNINRKHA